MLLLVEKSNQLLLR